jgi:biopolymer transport protein ExbD
MGVNVQLPSASKQTAEAQPDGVIVSLLPDGSVRVQDQTLSSDRISEIEPLLKQKLAQTASRLVVLEGDQKAFLGNAVRVMDLARRAGADRFAIATQEGP